MSKPIKIPALTTVSAEYAALIAKEQELRTKQRLLSNEQMELSELVHRATADSVSDAVAAALGDALDNGRSRDDARARMAEIAAELRVAEQALDVLRGRIATARVAASRSVIEEVRPAYVERVRALATALTSVRAAQAEYTAMTDALNIADVAWSPLHPLQPTRFLGELHDVYSGPAIWFREAHAAGYLKESDLPPGVSV